MNPVALEQTIIKIKELIKTEGLDCVGDHQLETFALTQVLDADCHMLMLFYNDNNVNVIIPNDLLTRFKGNVGDAYVEMAETIIKYIEVAFVETEGN